MNSKTLIDMFKKHPRHRRFAGLLDSRGVSPERVLHAVYVSVDEVVEALVPDANYSSEQLCGDELWLRWPTDGQHRAMGIGLSFLVETGLVPLVCVTPHHIRNKRYALKVSAQVPTSPAWGF
jgi:hypothetical protein